MVHLLKKDNRNSEVIDSIMLAKELFLFPLKENVHIEIINRPKLKVFIEDSEKNFFQVFLNLFENSLKAYKDVPSKQKIIHITLKINEEDFIFISVQDYACGILKKNIDKVFDLSFSTKDKKGSGLGLFLVKSAIESKNGTIKVESKENLYTRFVLKLPFQKEKSHKLYLCR